MKSNIGDLFVNIHANARGLVSGLAYSQKKLRKFSRSAARTGRQMETLSRGMLGLGASFALPVTLAIREFAKFEKSMASVATMLDDPRRHMGGFTSAVSDMAVEFGESTDALAGGLYDILSASIAPAKALDVLAVATKAAKGGLTDTKTAADAITTVLNSYGLSASDAGRVSDILFTIVKRGKTTFEEIAGSIGNVSTIAATAGVDLEELAATVAVLTRVGIKTDVAMTATKAVVTAFAKATPAARLEAKKLGLDLSAASLQADGLIGSMKKMAGVNFDKLAKIFPNIRALTAIAPALKDITRFKNDLDAMANSVGATDRAFSFFVGTVDYAMRVAGEAIKKLGRTIGEVLVGDTLDFAKTIKRIVGDMELWIKANANMVRGIISSLPTYAKWAAGLWLVSKALQGVAAASALAATARGAFAAKTAASGLAGAALAGGGAAAGAGAVAAGAGLTAMIAAGVSAGLVGAFAGNQIAGALGLLKDGKLEEKTAAAANSLADPSADLFTNIDKQLALVDELKREVQHHEDRSASWGLRTLEMIAGTVGLVETTATNSLQDASVRYSEASRTLTKLQQEADANRNKLLRIDTGQGKMAGIESDAAADDKRIAKRDAWIASTKHAFSTLGGLAGDAINATGEAWAKHMKSLEESARMIAKDMASQGLALTKSLRTPLEQFETKIAKAGELLAAGAISPEIFDRAIKDAQDALDRSRSTSGANQPGSIQTAIGTYKFAGANRSQQTIAASSASTAASSAAIAVSSAASAKALANLGPKP